MKKRLLSILSMVVMVVSMVACGIVNQSNVVDSTEEEMFSTEIVIETEEKMTSTEMKTEITESTEVEAEIEMIETRTELETTKVVVESEQAEEEVIESEQVEEEVVVLEQATLTGSDNANYQYYHEETPSTVEETAALPVNKQVVSEEVTVEQQYIEEVTYIEDPMDNIIEEIPENTLYGGQEGNTVVIEEVVGYTEDNNVVIDAVVYTYDDQGILVDNNEESVSRVELESVHASKPDNWDECWAAYEELCPME